MKYLIVNADDFGLSSGICRGIIHSHQHGIVTSTSVMAVGTAFEEGVELLHKTPTLATGVHLTLVGERPILPPKEILTLVRPDGQFHSRWRFLRLLALGRIRLDEVLREWTAQVRKCREAGLSITHLDSDDHLHMVPWLWKIAVELCQQFGIAGLRRPNESLFYSPNGFISLGILKKAVILAMTTWCPKNSLVRSEYCVGLSISGHLNKKSLAYLLSHLQEGTTELVCHPGFSDEMLLKQYGHWGFNWEEEVAALTAQNSRSLLENQEIILIRDAQHGSKACE